MLAAYVDLRRVWQFKHLVVGPVAVAALLVASAIAQHAPSYGDAHLMISSILVCRLV